MTVTIGARGTDLHAYEIATFGVNMVVLREPVFCNLRFYISCMTFYDDSKSAIFLELAFTQFFFDIRIFEYQLFKSLIELFSDL